jgi:hypothetical protein
MTKTFKKAKARGNKKRNRSTRKTTKRRRLSNRTIKKLMDIPTIKKLSKALREVDLSPQEPEYVEILRIWKSFEPNRREKGRRRRSKGQKKKS